LDIAPLSLASNRRRRACARAPVGASVGLTRAEAGWRPPVARVRSLSGFGRGCRPAWSEPLGGASFPQARAGPVPKAKVSMQAVKARVEIWGASELSARAGVAAEPRRQYRPPRRIDESHEPPSRSGYTACAGMATRLGMLAPASSAGRLISSQIWGDRLATPRGQNSPAYFSERQILEQINHPCGVGLSPLCTVRRREERGFLSRHGS
jgi:hypothetical protein